MWVPSIAIEFGSKSVCECGECFRGFLPIHFSESRLLPAIG